MQVPDEHINRQGNLSLAYLGDAVFELMVRAWLIRKGSMKSGDLHKAAVSYVKAPAQAELIQKLLPFLNEEEMGIYKRGRNTHVKSVPQNADISEYHAATGLETLFGYLYLKGKTEKLCELFAILTEE